MKEKSNGYVLTREIDAIFASTHKLKFRGRNIHARESTHQNITHLSLALAHFPLALVPRAGQTLKFTLSVKESGTVTASVCAVPVAVVLVAQRAAAGDAD